MPYYHCAKCHHEWEGTEDATICDWCDAPAAIILEDKTAFEEFVKWLLSEEGRKETANLAGAIQDGSWVKEIKEELDVRNDD